MGRFKKGQKKKNVDVWQQAGGRENVVKCFISERLCDDVLPEQWSAVTLAVFNSDNKRQQRWLKMIWQQDRRGVRTEALEGKLPVVQ